LLTGITTQHVLDEQETTRSPTSSPPPNLGIFPKFGNEQDQVPLFGDHNLTIEIDTRDIHDPEPQGNFPDNANDPRRPADLNPYPAIAKYGIHVKEAKASVCLALF